MQHIIEKLEQEFPNHTFSFTTASPKNSHFNLYIDGKIWGILTRETIFYKDFPDMIETILADGNFQKTK